jgi:low affinity Fe/Cu permease
MKKNQDGGVKQDREAIFDRFSNKISKMTGSSKAFMCAIAIVVLWAITGPIFHFSDTWQLVINTGTTIITFLMVFVIQEAQNKDTLAIQLKLNELIAATKGASNTVLNLEDMTEEELKVLKKFYTKLSALSQSESSATLTHTIDEMKR